MVEKLQHIQNLQLVEGMPFQAAFGDQRSLENAEVEYGDKAEAVLQYVEQEARSKAFVIAEGPPIYLWPVFKPHRWQSPAFVNGWSMVNALADRIPAAKLRHYVLVDDMNNRPQDVDSSEFEVRSNRLWRSSTELARSPVFSDDKSVVRFSETDLAAEIDSQVCSVIDAAFNERKVVDHMRESGANAFVYPENLHTLLQLVIGPHGDEVKAEQLQMLQGLYERLKKHPHFQRASKALIRNALCDMYRHVWVNRDGEPTQITQPIFDSRFKFINVNF